MTPPLLTMVIPLTLFLGKVPIAPVVVESVATLVVFNPV